MPDTDLESAALDLTQAVGLLIRRMRAATLTQGLSMTEAIVMARLDKDGAATIADLARAEAMKPQSMGATVAALEEMGLVSRQPHPTDGRQMKILLTAQGLALRTSSQAAKKTWLTQAMAQLPADDRATLRTAGDIIRRLVEQ